MIKGCHGWIGNSMIRI
jgi:hypothetical protein